MSHLLFPGRDVELLLVSFLGNKEEGLGEREFGFMHVSLILGTVGKGVGRGQKFGYEV